MRVRVNPRKDKKIFKRTANRSQRKRSLMRGGNIS